MKSQQQKKHVFLVNIAVLLREKMAGLHQTQDRAGDAPKAYFQQNQLKKQQQPKKQHPVNHNKNQLKLSVNLPNADASATAACAMPTTGVLLPKVSRAICRPSSLKV